MKRFNLPDIEDTDLDDDDWKAGTRSSGPVEPLHPLVRLWALRALAALEERVELESDRPVLASLFVALGLKQWNDYRSGARKKSGKPIATERPRWWPSRSRRNLASCASTSERLPNGSEP